MASEAWFWVPHPEEVWLPGKHQGGDSYHTDCGDVTCIEGQRGPAIPDKTELEGVDDCCSLSNVSAASILHTTRARYRKGLIYTNVSNVLIAVNPFKRLQIYAQEQIELYRSAQSRNDIPPHIFALCAEAFSGLFEDNAAMQSSQAVLISGESGAGKTETTKLVLLYTSEMLSGQEGGLEDSLMEINPIMEAFGNAKTVRNDNSSRFGKWIEVAVDPASRTLRGVSVTDFLLEVTRVCGQGPNERNFHIFYQLAADPQMAVVLKLQDASSSNYLCANPMQIAGVNDASDLTALRKALTTLKFSKQEEDEMFKTVGAILHIGNINFSTGDEAKILNQDVLATAAALLQVDAAALSNCICKTRRIAGKDVTVSPNDPGKAKAARDSMSKLLYGMLFKWIVGRCNASLGEDLGAETGDGPFLGVLDIAGFESFEKNLLEQLLINLSNEKLQQFFNNKVFKNELAEYKEEQIDVADIKFADNIEVLNLIEGPGGILAMLDDATNGVRQTDKGLVEKLLKEKASHPNFLKPKKFDPMLFGVSHYAGEVFYHAEAFLEKNSTSQPPEMVDLLRSSGHELLPKFVDEGVCAKPSTVSAKPSTVSSKPSAGGGKKPTVSAKYKKSLQQLMEKLKTANSHFVRCIKPNSQKVPDTFTSAMVMDQLRLCGVMETVAIRNAGYLIRSKYADFVNRYMICVPTAQRKEWKAAGDDGSFAAGILKAISVGEKESALGKTKVFLKSELYQRLEATRRARFEPFALLIQSCWRGYTCRCQMQEVREVDQQLRKCIQQAGHQLRAAAFQPKRVDRATVAESGLKQLDILLMRAVNLPIKVAYIQEATKLRAHIYAEVNLARKLSNLALQLNVFEMEEALALAKHHKLEGDLVEKVQRRLDAVKVESPLKEALHAAVDLDELEDLQKAVQDAMDRGLDVLSKWTMPSGAAIMEKAMVRKTELEEEKAKREAFLAAIRQEVDDHVESCDLKAVQETLARAAAAEIKGERIDKLAARCAALEIHLELQAQLQQCITSSSISEIDGIIELAKAQGICESTWTLPSGAADLANAEGRIAELKAEKDAEERASAAEKKKLIADIKAAMSSTDYVRLQGLVQRGKAMFSAESHPEEAKQLLCLEERLKRMDEEVVMIKKLQTGLKGSTRKSVVGITLLSQMESTRKEAADKGLTSREDAWILKEGHTALTALEEKIASIAGKEKILETLKQAAEEMDVPGLGKAIEKAVGLGVDEDSYKTYNQLNNKLQNANHVRDLMIKHKDNEVAFNNLKAHLNQLQAKEAGSSSMVMLKLQQLVVSNDTDRMRQALREADRAEVKGELVDQIRSLCITLEHQQPQLKKLQEALWSAGDLQSLQRVVAEFEESEGEDGMERPEEWPCEGLLNFYNKVRQKIEELQADRPSNTAVEDKLRKLKHSIDAVELREGIKEAEEINFTGALLEDVRDRFKTIEKQKAYLLQMRQCVLAKHPDHVRGVMEVGVRNGMDDPENWLLSDGPRSFTLLCGYLKELEARQKGEVAATAEAAAELEEMMYSTDISEIRSALAKAAPYKVEAELVEELQDRIKCLEEQAALVKQLRAVLRSTEAEQIQKVLRQVRAADLVNPRRWILPNGAKVFSKVVARQVWCERLEDLLSRVDKAVKIYNVRELEDCFKAGEYMCVPASKFKDAKALYLQLQDIEYVEQLLAELDAKKKAQLDLRRRLPAGGDSATQKVDEAITCLVQQRAHLGHSIDHTALKEVSQRAAGIGESAAGKPYYVDTGNITESVFYDLANFKNLRDPLTWSAEFSVSCDPDVRARAMVTFQAEKLLQSLTVLKPYSEKIAIHSFQDLQRCMGDKPSASAEDSVGPILTRLKVSPAVKDEIYIQVMKQLSLNPSMDSTAKGWTLLQEMIKSNKPSEDLLQFLIAFATREAKPRKKKENSGVPVKSAWRAAFFEMARQQREENVDDFVMGGFSIANIASMALQEERKKESEEPQVGRRMSMAEKKSHGKRRTSIAAVAEARDDNLMKKREEFSAQQVDMAKEVLRLLGVD